MGGWHRDNGPLSSTELMVKGQDSSWLTIPDSLPGRMTGIAVTLYNNQIYTSGKGRIQKHMEIFIYDFHYHFCFLCILFQGDIPMILLCG